MLKELGIPATIVIVRTGMRGDFETYPASLAPFDHAIAYVPSLDLYLDGTAEYTGATELPSMDRGALALQVNEGHPKLVHLPDPPAPESTTTRHVDITESLDGSAQLDWRLSVTGAGAGGFRQRYHVQSSRKERLSEDLGGEFAGLSLTDIDANNLEDIDAPVSLHVHAHSPDLARHDGAALAFPAGPRPHLVRDLAPLSARHLDMRLHAMTTAVSDWVLHAPPGTHVVSAPTAATLDSPFGSVHVTIETSDGPPRPTDTVHVVTTVVLSQTRVLAKDYPAFRAFCEAGDRLLGQQLVVSK
jgi:hypothetical protein